MCVCSMCALGILSYVEKCISGIFRHISNAKHCGRQWREKEAADMIMRCTMHSDLKVNLNPFVLPVQRLGSTIQNAGWFTTAAIT